MRKEKVPPKEGQMPDSSFESTPRETRSPLAFRRMASGSKSTVRYEDPLDDKIVIWLRNGCITGFQLEFNDKVMEYENGSYRYFEITDERGPTGYPAPPAIIPRKYIRKEFFLEILEYRSERIEAEQREYIVEKVRQARESLIGV
jgi:hypothetical protein